MAEDSSKHPKTSDEEWSNYEEDSEEQATASDESGSADDEDDADLTDRHSDDEEEEEDEKRQGQSDTETRNLLEDADFEEDVLFGDEEGVNLQARLPDELDDEIYAMSSEQQNYYIEMFLHLQYLTQGDAHLDGALRGSDELVVAFFRKSGLETGDLGKIWDLADVNIDGKLNRFEFCVAMHLIVLNKKGNVPIPKHLPAYFDLRITPQRLDESPRSSEGVSIQSSGSTQINEGGDNVVDSPEDTVKQHSRSDDKLHVLSQSITPFVPITEFAADPPMHVDRVPLPIRSNNGSAAQHTGTHSLGSANAQTAPISLSTTLPKGPPPLPPPRGDKGHTRSASLDLNAKPPAADFRNIGKLGSAAQRCLTLPANTAPPPLTTADPVDGLKQSKTLEKMFSPTDYRKLLNLNKTFLNYSNLCSFIRQQSFTNLFSS
jgi:hypothetical protein